MRKINMMRDEADEFEKIKKIALKSKVNMIGSVDFCGSKGNTSDILSNLNELQKMKNDDQGLLEFYKTKGMRTSLYAMQ